MSYAPPPLIGYATPQSYGGGTFESSAGRARIATVCITATVAVGILLTLASVFFVNAIDLDAIENGEEPPAWLVPASIGVGVVALVRVVTFILAAIFYCRWQHLAHRNLYTLGRRPTYTPGWGVGYWFIPIVNLFRPYQVLRDVTTLSDPRGVGYNKLGLYWACWIVSNVLSNVSSRLDEPAVLTAAATLEVVAVACEIAAALLIFRVMRFVVEHQARSGQPAVAVAMPA